MVLLFELVPSGVFEIVYEGDVFILFSERRLVLPDPRRLINAPPFWSRLHRPLHDGWWLVPA